MPCPTCGCAGHGQTWQVVCIRCRHEKYPVARERPTAYVCTLCRLDSPRQAAGRKGAAVARLQKAATARRTLPGGVPPTDLTLAPGVAG